MCYVYAASPRHAVRKRRPEMQDAETASATSTRPIPVPSAQTTRATSSQVATDTVAPATTEGNGLSDPRNGTGAAARPASDTAFQPAVPAAATRAPPGGPAVTAVPIGDPGRGSEGGMSVWVLVGVVAAIVAVAATIGAILVVRWTRQRRGGAAWVPAGTPPAASAAALPASKPTVRCSPRPVPVRLVTMSGLATCMCAWGGVLNRLIPIVQTERSQCGRNTVSHAYGRRCAWDAFNARRSSRRTWSSVPPT